MTDRTKSILALPIAFILLAGASELGETISSAAPSSAERVYQRGRRSPEQPSPALSFIPELGPEYRWDQELDYIWMRESDRGLDSRCWEIGAAGECGEFQITPIFPREVKRISGYIIDRADNASCRQGIIIWLDYYVPRSGAETVEDVHELYKRGPSGYRRWKGA